MRICRACNREIININDGRMHVSATEFYWTHEGCDPTPKQEAHA